jgi:thiol-disulfide isomerase/thioredoxin
MKCWFTLPLTVAAMLSLGVPVSSAENKLQTPLAEAVASFNEKASERLSKSGPLEIPEDQRSVPSPLTVDEVVRSIREWKFGPNVNEDTRRILQKIAETGVLPTGAGLDFRLQWEYDSGEFEDLMWWITLDVMTGVNTGYTHRIRQEKLGRRLALLPAADYFWVVDPNSVTYPPPGGRSVGGVLFWIDQDEKESLTITASWVPMWCRSSGQPPQDLRFVAFDEKANRHPMAERVIGVHNDLIMSRFRLDPSRLPASKVRYVGVEALDNDGLRSVSEAAVRRAREKRIEILTLPLVGRVYDFALTTAEGTVIEAAKLRGKVVLIDCWASWCGPCMKKMPELKKIYAAWHLKGLEILGLSFDQDPAAAKAAFKSHEIPWPLIIVPGDGETRQLWDEAARISSLPRILMIDQQGVLCWDSGSSPSQATQIGLEEKIAALFK